MWCKILLVAVFGIAAVASSTVLQGTCPIQVVDGRCKLELLCGRRATVRFQTGLPTNYTCMIAVFLCNEDKTVNVYSYFLVNGYLQRTLLTVLTQIGPGIVKRHYVDLGKTRTEYAVTYEVLPCGGMKLTSIQCEEGNAKPAQIVMISDAYEADFTYEIGLLSKIAPNEHLIALSNQCSPYSEVC